MFKKFATAAVLSAEIGSERRIVKDAHRHEFKYTPREGYLYVRSRAISSRCNDNFDMFPANEIVSSYRTFIGKPVFVNHHNDDHRRARGMVIDAALHRDVNPDGSPDTWVEALMEVDAVKFPKLAKAILAGEVDRTSMGCDVQISKCSVCHNEASSPLDYCKHIPAMKGKRIFQVNASTGEKEGKLVYEICSGLSFFENSLLVEQPADPTAYFLGKVEAGPGLEHLTAGITRTASRAEPPKGRALNAFEAGDHTTVWDLIAQAQVEEMLHEAGALSGDDLHMQRQIDDRYEQRPTDLDDVNQVRRHLIEAHGYGEDMFTRGQHGHEHGALHSQDGVLAPWYDHSDLQPHEYALVHGHEHQYDWHEPVVVDRNGLHAHGSKKIAKTAAGPKFANPGDHPYFQEHPVSPDHIVAHWHQATDDEKAQGKRWYSDAHNIASAIAKQSPVHHPEGADHMGAGVMAAYSPQSAWPSNMHNAARAMHTGEAIGGKGSGIMATTWTKNAAQRIMNGEKHDDVLKGPKIRDFAHLIEHGGDKDESDPHVVIDRHALSVAHGERTSDAQYGSAPVSQPHYYKHVVNAYHEAAKQISEHEGEKVHGHQVQAVTWMARQRMNRNEDVETAKHIGGQLAAGRNTNAKRATEKWLSYAGEHGLADHQSPGWHVGSKTALGETKAPQAVDTLRDENCSICGNSSAWDGTQCQVCGYVAPPRAFGEPNTDLAKQLDLRKDTLDGDEADPNDPTAQLGNEQGNPVDAPNPASTPALACTNCGTQVQSAQPTTSDNNSTQPSPAEGDVCPFCQKGELMSAASSPMADQDEGVDEDGSNTVRDPVPTKNAARKSRPLNSFA